MADVFEGRVDPHAHRAQRPQGTNDGVYRGEGADGGLVVRR